MDEPSELLDDQQPIPDGDAPVVNDSSGIDGPAAADGVSGLDRKAAADAYRKVLAGEELTVRDRAALKRFEKEKEERLRWQFYASIPQKHWREMSGRQAKVINEQASRYGIPFGGAMISLPAVVRAFHDFLADNAVKLAREDDALMQGSGSPALERYREERAAMARLDRMEREGQLLPRDEAREALGRIAAIIRGAGDSLQRRFGPEAADVLFEAMDDAEREIDRMFGLDGQGAELDPEQVLEPAPGSAE